MMGRRAGVFAVGLGVLGGCSGDGSDEPDATGQTRQAFHYCDEQKDLDGDGLTGCDDPCPEDAPLGGVDIWGDADADGVCNAVDNCALIANPWQDNSNSLSEIAHFAEILGDRCDPTPVPEADPVLTLVEDPALLPCVDPECPGATAADGLFLQCGTFYRSTLSLRPLRSQHKTDPNQWQDVYNVSTATRFCQADLVQGIECIDPFYDIDDARLSDADCAYGCLLPEQLQTHFHRVTFSAMGFGGNPNASLVPLDYTVADDDPDPGIYGTWAYQADYHRWVMDGLMTQPPNGAAGLQGNFWTHAHTLVGSDPNVTDKGFYHAGNYDAEQLANHHLTSNDGLNEEKYAAYAPEQSLCYACVHLETPYDVWGDGGSPGSPKPQPPAPHIVWRSPVETTALAPRRRDAAPHEASIVVRAPVGDAAMVRTATGACNGELAQGRLGPHLLARLADTSVRWVNVAEPMTSQGSDPDFPLAVALSSAPVDVIDTAVESEGVLTADTDRGLVREPGTDAASVTRYAAVLSRVRRAIYIVGGQDPATGTPTGAITWRPLDSKAWRSLYTPGYAPETVLAATYSFANDALYVLDERADSTARLTVVSIASGAATELGTWARNPTWDLHWLVADRDGSVLVASASAAAQKHVVTRVATNAGGLTVTGRLEGQKALVLPPAADRSGYTLVLRQAPEGEEVSAVRLSALPLAPAAGFNLGDQL